MLISKRDQGWFATPRRSDPVNCFAAFFNFWDSTNYQPALQSCYSSKPLKPLLDRIVLLLVRQSATLHRALVKAGRNVDNRLDQFPRSVLVDFFWNGDHFLGVAPY
ncbi:hypothetical protein HETIRDRAFT_322334 [Heterobasidion irregulare TC 32-1]|uniref:Uncharacterized protein n=1 Tax=Heterobasidion irregulare (strain TC 32-1) TaxID=747525 RepID=W4K2K9_HETIT|nr:uncharacterized protein HETIRDRAFT_322334 [Heterobasidion irregulare TC 32-1]ETW79590.1 hypothetical protein HETIRDRAFT_322334 [Heterobasidion irregulare TC 32-1]